MSTALEVTGFLMGIASWLLTGVSLANDYWKVSSFAGSVIISNRQYENLWHSCAESSTGIAECRDFESMLALSTFMQACRALMIIALILGLISMVVSILGLKCIQFGSSDEQTKSKISLAGGIMFILGGMCSMIAVSWYAAQVVQEFYLPQYGGIKFELGAGLYLGWAGASLSILGGALLCCACKDISSGQVNGAYYTASQGQKTHKTMSDTEKDRAYV